MKATIGALALSILVVFMIPNMVTGANANTDDDDAALKRGEIVVSYRKEGDIEYVVGRVRIPHPPQRIWPILANPFEFERTISPRFHTTRVVVDQTDRSVLESQITIGMLIPNIKYTVESNYDPLKRITFKSTKGDLKDFQGSWMLQPSADGKQTDITYSMYVNPGIPVPQWLVRQGIKNELPHTLDGLRERVESISTGLMLPVKKTLAAARFTTAG